MVVMAKCMDVKTPEWVDLKRDSGVCEVPVVVNSPFPVKHMEVLVDVSYVIVTSSSWIPLFCR